MLYRRRLAGSFFLFPHDANKPAGRRRYENLRSSIQDYGGKQRSTALAAENLVLRAQRHAIHEVFEFAEGPHRPGENETEIGAQNFKTARPATACSPPAEKAVMASRSNAQRDMT